ncbi:MAG TPA: cytochrome ubiquinol oxidase subunit I [Fimbriimonadaceae bacterium]|nr:cytochrome ubiquinol oxidase subunit I [Fimbriimonadaceae bacterium]
MNYPVWEVPIIGLPWVVGIIAIFHIMIAHFAVGGGIYLAVAERKALKEGRTEWLPVLKHHSKFFLILTAVFGTVSGVGIWFAIGLIHPEATSTLIHNFVFGWAIEWVFFIVELTAAAVYYYSWSRIPDKLHAKVGVLYAVASVCTMVIINGILTFMLYPGSSWLGAAGTGQESAYFWPAFFNPTYFPSLVLRLLSAMSLAGVWALVSYARLDDTVYGAAKVQMVRWSATWLAPAFVLMPFAFLWYISLVPSGNRHLLELGMTTIGSGAFTQVTRIGLIAVITTSTIAGVVYFFAFKYPKDFTFGHAISVLMLALAATASTEYAREAIRKPFVIGEHMYSNGVRVRDVARFNQDGYLANSMWAPKGPNATPIDVGRVIFRGECMSCHTIDGYRSMRGFLAIRDDKALDNMIQMLRSSKSDAPYHAFMPPLVGTDAEIADLRAYLIYLRGPGPNAKVAEK